MKCPDCGRTKPDSEIVCICGYIFPDKKSYDEIHDNKALEKEPTKSSVVSQSKDLLGCLITPFYFILMLALNAAAYGGALVSVFCAFLCFIDFVMGRSFKSEIVTVLMVTGLLSAVAFVLLRVTDMDLGD